MITEIVGNLTGSLVDVGEGIGGALSSMATSIFTTTDGGLSTFGTLVTVFAGLSLAFGLTRWVLNFISSLGARNG